MRFYYHLTSPTGFDYQYGWIPIYKKLQGLKIPGELYLDSDAGHGLDSTSRYGLQTNNIDSIEDYIISRAAIFFAAVLNNTTGNIKQTMFEDTKDTTSNCDYLALPVIISNLKAYQHGSTVTVNWTSFTETNITSYGVQRSADGINFTIIGSVQATGNSLPKKDYSFNDMQPLKDNNYYRIQVADNDRKLTYSETVLVNIISTGKAIIVYPVPAKNVLHVQLSDKGVISLTDQAGKILITQLIDGRGEINISKLTTGVYYLKENTTGTTQKIVITK